MKNDIWIGVDLLEAMRRIDAEYNYIHPFRRWINLIYRIWAKFIVWKSLL